MIPDKIASDVEIIVTSHFPLSREILERLKNLKFILVASTGYNYIDLDFAKKNKILVCNCTNYVTVSVAK